MIVCALFTRATALLTRACVPLTAILGRLLCLQACQRLKIICWPSIVCHRSFKATGKSVYQYGRYQHLLFKAGCPADQSPVQQSVKCCHGQRAIAVLLVSPCQLVLELSSCYACGTGFNNVPDTYMKRVSSSSASLDMCAATWPNRAKSDTGCAASRALSCHCT